MEEKSDDSVTEAYQRSDLAGVISPAVAFFFRSIQIGQQDRAVVAVSVVVVIAMSFGGTCSPYGEDRPAVFANRRVRPSRSGAGGGSPRYELG